MHHGAASKTTVARSTFPFLFAVVSFAVEAPIRPAFAADCGLPDGSGVVTCTSGGNPYSGGISYNSLNGNTLIVESGTTIAPTVDGRYGIYVGTSDPTTMVNLADHVSITTHGIEASGVYVYGTGDISISSAATITVDSLSVGNATSGLLAWNIGPSGNVNVIQAEGSIITASGGEVGGIYGLNDGSGSVTVTSSGTISTDGDNGVGISVDNSTPSGLNAKITLEASGAVTTYGTNSAGLYNLNYGTGDALVVVRGKITTMADGSYGLADIKGPAGTGAARVVLSDTATILTMGDDSRGAWASNRGAGETTLNSAGTVTTNGVDAYGLFVRNDSATNAAVASISLEGSGSVVTNGASAYGMYALHQGVGAATVTMENGTSVATTGNLADGVRSESLLGTASVTQEAGAPITVSGEQAFGVNVIGEQSATAVLRGTVSASGKFGVGAASFSAAGAAGMTIAANAAVTGGWQDDVTDKGADTALPSAGVLVGSGTSSQLTNFGTIGAGSDRAIADISHYQAGSGNLVVNNTGRITGFIELAGNGTNVFNNNASGVFDVRHFADTDGDGVRDTKRVAISDFGNPATSIFNNLSGATVRLAPVVGETKVNAASYYVPTTGIDSRPLEASYYALDRSGVVQGQFTNLGEFHNAGVIDLRGSATGNTMVMTGSTSAAAGPGNGVFISDGGRLLLNTVLNAGVAAGGQTGSFSDVLVVDSTRMGTGATTITIDRKDGTGAATPGNGILLVEVRDKAAGASAPGVFVLNGDYVANGAQAVIKGAYAYNLFQNGVGGDDADGNWYLRSRGYAPTTPVYEEYPKVIVPLINPPTLQQRVGNRYWNEPGLRTPQMVFCKDPARNYRCEVTDEQAKYYVNSDGTVIVETNSVWARTEAAYGRYQPSSTSGANYDSSTQKIQAGVDGLLAEGERGKLVGGITAHYGHVSSDIRTAASKGNIRADGYGAGGTLTWYGNNGFYVDAQAQATWFTADLSSATLGRRLADGNEGLGYALSLETGQRIALSQHWTLTPQVQLAYLDTRFDRFTDAFGATVALIDGSSLRGRLGLAAEYQERWRQANGKVSRISAYGIANLYNEFLNGTRVNVSGTELVSSDDGLWGGLGFGGSYNWDDDRYSIYGQVVSNTVLARFGDSYDVGGTLGLRVKW